MDDLNFSQSQQQFNNQQQDSIQNNAMIGQTKNYLAFAIFTTVCCCLPTGIYAVIRASKANAFFTSGQTNLGYQAADDAKKWSIIGLIIGVVIWILNALMYIMGFASLASLANI